MFHAANVRPHPRAASTGCTCLRVRFAARASGRAEVSENRKYATVTAGRLEPKERIRPRPVLLISSGTDSEADADQVFLHRAGRGARLWNLPNASHASAIRTDPAGYESHVIPFLNRALRPRLRVSGCRNPWLLSRRQRLGRARQYRPYLQDQWRPVERQTIILGW